VVLCVIALRRAGVGEWLCGIFMAALTGFAQGRRGGLGSWWRGMTRGSRVVGRRTGLRDGVVGSPREG